MSNTSPAKGSFRAAADRLFAREQKSTSDKITRNVLFSALRAMLLWPIPFLLIPFIIYKIGTRDYGLWAVFLTVINLTSLADFGLGGTLTKDVAEHYAKGNLKALKRLLDTGLALYLFIATVVVGVLSIFCHRALLLLFRGETGQGLRELESLWSYVVIISGLNIITIPFYSIVTGLQRMDLSNILTFISVSSGALFTVLFLTFGWQLQGLLCANTLAAAITLFLVTKTARKLLPEISINPLLFDYREMRHIFTFSLQLYVTQTSIVIQNQIEKLYLAWFVGATAVGWYNIAAEVAQKIKRIPELLLSPIMAAASELYAVGDQARLSELYYRSHKYLALFAVPLALYIAEVSRSFVVFWLGSQLKMVAFPLTILVTVNLLNLACGPGALILIGRGNLKPAVIGSAVSGSLILSLSLLIVYLYGFSGAVIGILIATIAATAVFFRLFHKSKFYSFHQIVSHAYLKPIVCSIAALAAVHFTYPFLRLGWAGLAAETVLFGLAYIVGLTLMKFFDDFDLKHAQALGPLGWTVWIIAPRYFVRRRPARDV